MTSKSMLPSAVGWRRRERALLACTHREMVLALIAQAALTMIDHQRFAHKMFAAMDEDQDQYLAFEEMSILSSPPQMEKGVNRARLLVRTAR